MDSCVHKVVDHHEGSRYLGVGGHEGEALKLSIIRAPGASKARGVSLTVIEGGNLGSGGNLFKNRPRASTSKYKQLPINLRLFQNTVKLLALGTVQYSFCLNIAFTHLNMLPVPNA